MSNIERGRENPTLDLLLRLAEALRVSPAEIFDYEAKGLERKALQAEVRRIIERCDVERLRIALKVLRVVLR